MVRERTWLCPSCGATAPLPGPRHFLPTTYAAACLTCHGGHDVLPVEDPRSKVSRRNIIKTCGGCHAGIERDYLEGVHGKDYVKGIQDVPVCTDCHSEHDIRSPESLDSGVYATRVAAVCARCHDDERLARQYGLLTSRLKTYASSYHGMASKSGETRVANCSSCHGHHDVRPSSDPRSSVNAANMAATCGACHPGAGANFAKGRIHVVSERTENRLAYTVKIVYLVVIGGLISVFLAFIAADLYRRLRGRWTR
jgi:predicted CXXCH cytochrome family protein